MDSFLSNAAALHTPGCSSSLQQISSTNCAVMLSAHTYALFRESWKCTVCLQYEGVLLGLLLKTNAVCRKGSSFAESNGEIYIFFLFFEIWLHLCSHPAAYLSAACCFCVAPTWTSLFSCCRMCHIDHQLKKKKCVNAFCHFSNQKLI